MDRQDFSTTTPWETPQEPLAQLPAPAPLAYPHPVTDDDRLMAALAHASMWLNLVSGFLGLAVSAGIWLVYRNRQRWVARQALQATFLQIVMILAIGLAVVSVGLGTGLWWTLIGLLFFPLACLAALGVVGLFAYSLYAAYQVYQGRDFRYPIVGIVMDTP